MLASWKGKVTKGGSGNTGWITFPAKIRKNLENDVKHEHMYNVNIKCCSEREYSLHVRLRKTGYSFGFYIPAHIVEKEKLITSEICVSVFNTEYYSGRISSDKRVSIPLDIVKEMNIQPKDLYKVEFKIDNITYTEIVIINITDRYDNRSDEYNFTVRMNEVSVSSDILVKITDKIKTISKSNTNIINGNIFSVSMFDDNSIIGDLGENILVFNGNHVPLIVKKYINIETYSHYFGCYYADGTKKANDFSINASTPEQAIYYLKIINEILFHHKRYFRLTYTVKPYDIRDEDTIKNNLISYWHEKANVLIESRNIKLIRTSSDKIRNWSPRGSLRIIVSLGLALQFHVNIMNLIVKYIKDNNNRILMWSFLFGIMEGDGYVSGGKEGFGLGIATSKDDIIIRESLNKLQINYSVDSSRTNDGVSLGIQISFGLIQVLNNLEILNKNLFIYYPKRRKIFTERLLNKPTVVSILKNENIHADNSKTKNILLSLQEELSSLTEAYDTLFNTYT